MHNSNQSTLRASLLWAGTYESHRYHCAEQMGHALMTVNDSSLYVYSGALEKVARLPGGEEAVSSVTSSSEIGKASRTAFPVRLV